VELINFRNPNCTACPLHVGVKTVCLFGEGNTKADLMIVGEAPGREEDEGGRPFIGQSGKLLRNILAEYKLSPGQIYISNSVKCRPPDNRRPNIKEVAACAHYLIEEIKFVKPKLIVALGQTAAGILLKRLRQTITESRGKVYKTAFKTAPVTPVIITYHPAAVVRDNTLIEAVFVDFEFIMRVLREGAPERKKSTYKVGLAIPKDTISVDLETEGLNPYAKSKQIVCCGTSIHSRSGYCTSSLDDPNLRKILVDKSITKVGHNIKFDICWLLTHGYEVNGPIYDTLVGEHLCNENHPNYGLKELAASFTDMGAYSVKMEKLLEEAEYDIRKVPLKTVMNYCAQDADAAWRLRLRQLPVLREEGLQELCTLVMAGERVVARAEVHGVYVDREWHAKLKKIYEKKIPELEKKIKDICGEDLTNINSSVQLGKILTGKLGFRIIKHTKTGKVSVDEDALKQLESDDTSGIIRTILKYRKVRGDYSKYLGHNFWQYDGKVHTNFRIAGTDTGRYSCTKPNLQAVPRDSPIKYLFRSKYRNGRIIQIDYEQGELRLLAHLSQDKKLLKAFKDELDIHKLTACQIFQVPFSKVSDKQRFVGKTINFGTIYGMGPEKLQSELHKEDVNVSVPTAAKFLHQFRETYPDVKKAIRDRGNEILENGYVVNPFGRRRRITILDPENIREVKEAQRKAFNAPIQGGLHDLNILSTVELDYKLRNYRSTIILFVHDSILIDAPAEEVAEVVALARSVFENPDTSRFGFELTVPMPVSIKVGSNWKEASNAEESGKEKEERN
jgi:DNA polymerase I